MNTMNVLHNGETLHSGSEEEDLFYEKEVALAPGDIAQVYRILRALKTILLVFVVLIVAFLIPGFILPGTTPVWFLALPVQLATVVIGGNIWQKSRKNMMRIIVNGKKTIIRGIVTARFKKHTTHRGKAGAQKTYLRIGMRELNVLPKHYYRYKVGDGLEIHYAKLDLDKVPYAYFQAKRIATG